MYETWVLLVTIICLETLAQFLLEKKVKTKETKFLLSGIVAYAGVAYVYYLMLKSGSKLAVANAFWNAGTGLTVTIVGWLMFGQKLTMRQVVGLIITTIGITILN